MKKILFITALFITALVLFSSCSIDVDKQDKQDKFKYIKLEGADCLYYRYFYLDNHEYIHFDQIGYFEQVIHSPNCTCNNKNKKDK